MIPTDNRAEGYRDGFTGQDNRFCSPEYCEGWEAGWRERMLAWEETRDE